MQVKHGHVIFQIDCKSGTTNFSLSMTASTGGATNLQQVQFGTFEYTESAVTQVRYVDVTTGKDIIPPKHIQEMLIKS